MQRKKESKPKQARVHRAAATLYMPTKQYENYQNLAAIEGVSVSSFLLSRVEERLKFFAGSRPEGFVNPTGKDKNA